MSQIMGALFGVLLTMSGILYYELQQTRSKLEAAKKSIATLKQNILVYKSKIKECQYLREVDKKVTEKKTKIETKVKRDESNSVSIDAPRFYF